MFAIYSDAFSNSAQSPEVECVKRHLIA